MKNNLIPSILLFFTFLFHQAALAQNSKIYVWDFSYRDGKTDDLTISLTDELEEALLRSECCEVLQRRNYSRLFQQRENEKAISGASQLSSDSKNRLTDINANTVVFGVLHDDTRSGQFKISVSFENLNGTIEKGESVYMAKYDVNNPKKREEAIAELLDKLKLKPMERRTLETKIVDDWTFEFKGCQRVGKDVKCSYVVTSNYRDRKFGMEYRCVAYDEFNYEYKNILNQKLADKSAVQNTIEVTMIDGIPVPGFIVFGNVSSRATRFARLDFAVYGDDLTRQVFQFRDVPIE